MKTLETDVEIGVDGSVKLLSPLPAWLKPGRAHVLMTVESVEENALLVFIDSSPIYALDDEVIEQSILLRQQKKMKLGDAIITTTAVAYGIPLVTRNEDDFKHITGLDLRNPFAIVP